MNELAFDHPGWLLGLWLLVPLALLLARAERRRRAAALDFALAPMAERLLPPISGPRPWLRGGALLAALGFLLVAAAGPRFGVTFEPVSERGADLLVLLDVSKSMLSQDVAPNRLERAKSDVRDLVARVVGHRLGLVVFAGKAVVACPLTTDRGFFLQALDQVDPRSAPRGGTAIGDAIRVALQTMPPQHDRDQALILITDGEDQDSYPLEAAKAAAARGVKIFAVGLGDPTEGARVPVRGEDGGATFLKHDGQEVWSKMQEGLLTDLATQTGGAYVPARTSAYDLGEIYARHLADLSTGEIRMAKRRRLTPRFQLFLALGLAFALLERLIGPARRRPGSASAAPAAPLRAAALLAVVAFGGTAHASDAPEDVRVALELLKQGKADDALVRLEAAATAAPKNLAIVFDRACAKEAKGDFDGARADLLTVAAGREAALANRAQYNLGTLAAKRAELALGEKPDDAAPDAREKARTFVEAAIRHFRACLAADADHGNARRNLETLRVWLKHMEDVWARKDQEKAREEKDVLQFLDWLHEQEAALRALGRATAREPDSPLRRTAVAALARRQRELADEIPYLKEKIAKQLQQALAPPPAAAGAPPSPGAAPPPPAVDPKQIEAAMSALAQVADGAGGALKEAGGHLDAARFAEADGKGKEAQSAFDGLWLVFGSFESVVSRGVKLAQGAVDGTQPFVAADVAAPADALPKFSGEPEARLGVSELDERVATLADALGQKAAADQEELAKTPLPPPAPTPTPAPPPDPNRPPDPDGPPDADAQPDPAAERAALEQALKLAIDHAPKIGELANSARDAVAKDDAEAALGDEAEALRLLKEIADALPKHPQDDSQQDQQQQEQQPQEPKPDEGKDPKDDSKQEQQKPSDDGKDGKQDEKPKPDQLTKEQAQALLRKAVERAKQKAEQSKEAQQAVGVPGRVDRDW